MFEEKKIVYSTVKNKKNMKYRLIFLSLIILIKI